ncbi:retron Eco8 family effector endonuclease [Brevibacillus fortis]|uniref:retron Eco8 family effector endonuclease n=1 Tax=Brevibacillus fortis TaxID=2126352 RepID=UPI0038FBF1C8
MSIKKITIKNVKSIRNETILFSDVTCLIGENGSGKTNIINSINFFYDSLVNNSVSTALLDTINPYHDFFEVTMFYDFTFLNKIVRQYLNRSIFSLDSDFFNKIYELSQFTNNDELSLRLRKNKNGTVEWLPEIPYELRSSLKNLFPVYMIKCRHINLTDWEKLWEFIGDFSKLPSVDFQSDFEKFFSNTFGTTYTDTTSIIKSVLQKSNIETTSFGSQELFIKILQLQLNGSDFNHKNENLDYYSDGINSFNFLVLLGGIIGEISRDKIKHALIILDEPETGLHPQYIDKLVKAYNYESGKPQVVLSTHSPRIVKNIVKSKNNSSIYHIALSNNYSKIKRMRKPDDLKEINKITDQEAGYYFAKGIVFVEGDTEIELFSNEKIRELFQFLNFIDFYSFDGNSVKLNIVHPKRKNINIPYLVIVDMDKILKVDSNKVKIVSSSNEHINPLASSMIMEKEKFYFGKKRDSTHQLRKRINGLINKSTFSIDSDWWYINSSTFKLIKSLVLEYCREYNVYTVDTTIEGALVNNLNSAVFIDWLKKKYNTFNKIFDDLYNFKDDSYYQTTVSRLIVNGKYDILRTKGEFQKHLKESERTLNNQEKKIYDTINIYSKKYVKTSGWVTEWIDYIFEEYIDKEIEKKKKIEIFELHFKELYDIIKTIETKVVNNFSGE